MADLAVRALTPEQYRDTQAESDLQTVVVLMAQWLGYLVYHNPDSRRSEAGYPDLHIVGHGLSIFVELKTAKGYVRKEQRRWKAELQAAGLAVAVVRPAGLDGLEKLLRTQAEGTR